MSVDFPRAYEIAGAIAFDQHHEKCSYRVHRGGFLCDCDVLWKHAEVMDEALHGAGGTVSVGHAIERPKDTSMSTQSQSSAQPEHAIPRYSVSDVKALYDALLSARLAVRTILSQLREERPIPRHTITSLEEQYEGTDEQSIDSLPVIVSSRKQFDNLAIQAIQLRRTNEQLLTRLRVAREERDELANSIRSSKGQS